MTTIIDLSGNTIKAAGFTNESGTAQDATAANAKFAAIAALTALTDSTGVASPNSTIENVPAATAASTDTSAASLTSVNASLTAIENSLADLAAKINAIRTAAGGS